MIIIFQKANEIMSSEFLSNFLYKLGNDHSYHMEDTQKIESYCQFLAGDDNQFLNTELEPVIQDFLKTSLKIFEFTAYKFHIFPSRQTGGNPRLCLAPNLNIDREGDGSLEQMKKYDRLTTELESLIDELREKYRIVRSVIKSTLII